MSLTWEALNSGEYLSAADFMGHRVTKRIASIEKCDFEMDDGTHKSKGVVEFADTDKKWVLNTTNIQLLKAMFPTVDGAIGKRVTLAPEKVQFGRETVEGIRVVGSPDIDGDVTATVKLPRKKATTRVLSRTEG